MEQLQQRILEIFKEFKTPVNGILKPQSLEGRISKWDRRSQDEAQESLSHLMSNGYVGMNEGWLTLTQKGYDFLYDDYSILDTEAIILNLLQKRNLKTGHVIMENWFNSELPKLERIHFDNFDLALENIINKGFIEVKTNGWFLTQQGYDKIY